MKRIVFFIFIFCMGGALTFNNSLNAQEKNPFAWQKKNTSIKLTGYVKLVTSVDFDGSIDNNDFITADIPVPNTWDSRSKFGMDASQSRLGLEVLQKTKRLGDIKFYIETDFRGSGTVLRLRQAYISFRGFTIGQAWSLLYDGSAHAPTIDFQGDDSKTMFRTPLISYSHNIIDNLSGGIGIEYPKIKMTVISGVKTVSQRMPDIAAYLQYKGAYGHIKVSGVLRGLSYGNTIDEKVETVIGWGFQGTASIKPFKPITFYGQWIYGHGIARYINDLAYLNVDLMPNYTNPGQMKALKMFGISFGTKIDLCKEVFISGAFSMANMKHNNDYTVGTDLNKGHYASGAIFWKVINNLTIGAEYLNGKRINMSDENGHANRIQLMVKYDLK